MVYTNLLIKDYYMKKYFWKQTDEEVIAGQTIEIVKKDFTDKNKEPIRIKTFLSEELFKRLLDLGHIYIKEIKNYKNITLKIVLENLSNKMNLSTTNMVEFLIEFANVYKFSPLYLVLKTASDLMMQGNTPKFFIAMEDGKIKSALKSYPPTEHSLIFPSEEAAKHAIKIAGSLYSNVYGSK